jgi:hypothetical protein
MGDVIWTTPIVRQIWRDHGGDCLIDVLTLKPEVFAGSPWVDTVLTQSLWQSSDSVSTTINLLDLASRKIPLDAVCSRHTRSFHMVRLRASLHLRPQLLESRQDQALVQQLIDLRECRRVLGAAYAPGYLA